MIEVLGMNYYSVPEIAEKLKLHLVTVRKYITSGRIPAKKIGRSYFVSEMDFFNYMETDRTDKKKDEKAN